MPGSLLLFSLIVFYVSVRVWRLTSASLWADEIFSLEAARLDWTGLFTVIIDDIVHPPLFYMLLKLWIQIGGEDLLWLRLFPAVASIAAIVPLLFLSRNLKLRRGEVAVVLVLLTFNGYLIDHAQNLRMYSLLMFLSLCSLWAFVRFTNSANTGWKSALALFAGNLLLVFTHYY